MAQLPLMSTKTQEILARDLGLLDFDFNTFTVKTGVTTMVPGMLVTTFGESGTDIDILADGDDYCTGIVLRRKTRKISADGSVVDTINTPFAAGDEVYVLYMTGGRAHVWMWLTGLNIGKGNGAVRRGCPVFIPEISTITALAVVNQTVGAGMALLMGTLDLFTGLTSPMNRIGHILEDVTIGNGSQAFAGVLSKVSF